MSAEKYDRYELQKRRITIPHMARIRKLKQYRDMTDEEFEQVMAAKVTGVLPSIEFETRIENKLKAFAEDYDIDDLKSNDMLTLRALAQAYITLEDLENYSYTTRKEGFSTQAILEMEKVNNVMSSLRRDISKMQDDLNITRRVRKGDKEESVINYLEDLKSKAKLFYQKRMLYIFCPECKMLLATLWALYPEEKGNKIQLICNRKLENGLLCKYKIMVGTKELLEKRGANMTEIPEFFV